MNEETNLEKKSDSESASDLYMLIEYIKKRDSYDIGESQHKEDLLEFYFKDRKIFFINFIYSLSEEGFSDHTIYDLVRFEISK